MLNNLFKLRIHIYKKIIIIFLILLIPMYFLNILINIIGSNYIRNEISKSVLSNVEYYSKQLDDELAHIKLQQIQFMNNTDLLRFSFSSLIMDDFEKIQVVKRINEHLAVIANSSKYIKNAGVYIKSFNHTISVEGGINKIPNSDYNIVEKAYSNTGVNYVDYYQQRMFFIESYPKKEDMHFSDNQIIMYIEISTDKIGETLKELEKYKDSSAMLTDDNITFTILSDNSFEVSDRVLSQYKAQENKFTGTFKLNFDMKNYWVSYCKSNLLNLTVLSYLPSESVTGVLKNYNLLFIILLLVSVIVVVVFSFLVNAMIHKPMKMLTNAFKVIEESKLNAFIEHRRDDEFGYLFKGFNGMLKRLKQSIEQNYEQKMALQKSEFKQLQSQINPHFLYNCFFNINRMCKAEDFENAMEISQKLGSYYRYITRSGSDEVPFYLEYQHALDYVQIQSIRFLNRIKVHIGEVPEKCKNLMVPRIILQPVLENAYEHAFEKSVDGGNIYTEVSYFDDKLTITVEDDGQHLSDDVLEMLKSDVNNPSNVAEKTGIINVCMRLRLKYGDDSGLYVSRSKYGGLKVEILLYYSCVKEDLKCSEF